MSRSAGEAYSGTNVGDRSQSLGNDGLGGSPEPTQESSPSPNNSKRSPATKPREEFINSNNIHSSNGKPFLYLCVIIA